MKAFAKPQSGLTLLEMLVTLVIIGLASTMVIQSIFSIAQFDQRLQEWQGEDAEQALKRLWLQQALMSVVPSRQIEEKHFSGEPTGFRAWVVNPPWPEQAGPIWVEISLRQETNNRWSLIATSQGLSEWTLASDLQQGQFDYLVATDSGISWQSQWTAPQFDEDIAMMQQQAPLAVPYAIRFRGGAGWLDQTVLITATRNPQLSQRNRVDFH